MQFKLDLFKESSTSFLPLNYRHSFSNSISGFLSEDATSTINGNAGFLGKSLQPFTFGQLNFDSFIIHQQEESIEHHGAEASVELRVLMDEGEEALFTHQLLNQRIRVGEVQYRIVKLKSMPVIDFQDVMVYRCVCPISLKNASQLENTTYLSPKDHSFQQCFKVNLIQRLIRAHPEVAEIKELGKYCPEFQFELLTEPEMRGLEGDTSISNPQDVIGYQFDFKLKAAPVLHEYGFYEGFGLQHSMGWGFVDVIA